MNNNQDKELVELIQRVKEGKAEKKELCNKIYKEVYALSYPVYKDEEKSMTQAKKALIEVCGKLEHINLEKNVHKQIAVIVSVYFLNSVVNENEDELKNSLSVREYNYSRIKEDEELLEYMKKKAGAFRSPKTFDEQEKVFTSLNQVQMALVELYVYEMQSVETIEKLTDIDSTYIGSWIAEIKAIVLGLEDADTVYAAINSQDSDVKDTSVDNAETDGESDSVKEDDYEEDDYDE